MKYGFRKNIRVLWRESSPESGGSPKVIPKTTEWAILNWLKNLASWLSETSLSELKDIASSILEAEKSDIQEVRETYKILKATGAIPEISVGNIKSLIGRWMDWSWVSWLRAVLSSLSNARKGNISIVTYSNKQYQSYSMADYDAMVSIHPDSVNPSIVKWLLHLYTVSNWSNSNISFKKETWESIATYCAKREWKTNIVWWDDEIATFLWTKYDQKVQEQEIVYDGILKNFIGKMSDTNLRKLLTENKLEKTADGKIDIRKIVVRLNITTPKQVPELLKNESENLQKKGQELLNRAREDQKKLTEIKDLKSLNIPNIPSYIERKVFASFTLDECNKYIPVIDEIQDKEKDPKRQKEIEKVKAILIKLKEGYMNIKDAWALATQAKESDKLIRKNPEIDLAAIIQNAESSEVRKKESLAGDASITRATIEQWRTILKDMDINISSFEDLQKKYNELLVKEKTSWLSDDEQKIKAQLYAQIQSNIRAAQVIKNYEWLLSKEDIQEVFTDANRFISNNPKETYNFQALEKIATLTDPESTPSQKSLARLEPGREISMGELFRQDGDRTPVQSSPEIAKMTISKNPDGTYNIPMFEAKNINERQVQEYKNQSATYVELGLSQFIPHIPLIIWELQNQGIDAKVDGHESNQKQEQILKYLYKKLFGKEKEILPASVPEIMQKFWSARWNPTNMRSSMQDVLMKNGLIPSPDQPITWDSMVDWFRKNTNDANPTDPLRNLL
jgi:hypothetical protein